MLLDRIDIDAHGPLSRVEIGPLTEHLNAVFCPAGAGKTAIARFIRDSLIDREYPLGMMSSSTGRVVWADRHGMVHCRREQDGTGRGRRTVEFETRSEYPLRYDSLKDSWIDGAAERTEASLTLQNVQLPESIVDGVITDTHSTSVSRVVSACLRNGLDTHETYDQLPLHGDASDRDTDEYRYDRVAQRQRHLRAELADVEAQLNRLDRNDVHQRQWTERLHQLRNRLAELRTSSHHHGADSTFSGHVSPHGESAKQDAMRRDGWRRRLSDLHHQADRLRNRQAELRRWIEAIEQDASPFTRRPSYDRWSQRLSDRLRGQVRQLDGEIVHLRRALVELAGVRESLERSLGHDSYSHPTLERFVGALDHFDPAAGWHSFYDHGDRSPWGYDDVRYRVDAVTRHIDWLLRHHQPSAAWSTEQYRAASLGSFSTPDSSIAGDSLIRDLKAIREELAGVTRRTAAKPWHAAAGVPYASEQSIGSVGGFGHVPGTHGDRTSHHLAKSEEWLRTTIERLSGYREQLIREVGVAEATVVPAPYAADEDFRFYDRHPNWYHERSLRHDELNRVTGELEACLREAAELRRSLRVLPVVEDRISDEERAMQAELRQLEHRLSAGSRYDWLQRRRRELLEQLGGLFNAPERRGGLAEAASRWLLRLSGGRLARLDWDRDWHNRRVVDDHHRAEEHYRSSASHLDVLIDNRPERECSASDRALASIATRMAAGELLARLGKAVPLVVEMPGELLSGDPRHGSVAYHEPGDDGRRNSPLAAALLDYGRAGRQLLLLTSDGGLSDQLRRTGGRVFNLHRVQTVHPHRPLWKPHYAPEHYRGPYPHTSDSTTVQHVVASDDMQAKINRDFDVAWHDADGIHDTHRTHVAGVARTDRPVDGTTYRDGYYYADEFTTVRDPSAVGPAADAKAASRQLIRETDQTDRTTPFFLTVDSPIDQAPSIDAVVAARLRGLGVTHINHLMRQDSNRLADSLGLGDTNAATVRRWQHECRLVCRVPQLRGFDARVLVGCGITDPAQLAAIHPGDLLKRVQSFLATERGQRILLSGSSYELSRITSWIASANRGVNDHVDGLTVDGRKVSARTTRAGRLDSFDQERYEVRAESDRWAADESLVDRNGRHGDSRPYGRRRSRSGGTTRDVEAKTMQRRRSASRNSAARGSGRRRRRQSDDSGRSAESRGSQRAQRSQRDVVRMRQQPAAAQSDRHGASTERELRFYLHRQDDVVDAPSIGPKMAARLNTIGIYTVDDLLTGEPASIAEQLGLRRIDTDTVIAWQQQATMVCRVPMLRGHDAQLLIAADITTPEELAECDVETLFAVVDPVARGPEGKRILRGGALPDREEIEDWICYGGQHRELRAA